MAKSKRCLMCEKKLKILSETGGISDGGYAIIQFGYGSRHDQIGTFPPEEPLSKILNADEIRFFICDDCFEKNIKFFTGINIVHTTKETEV